jgi:hypothetical protein
MVAAKGKPDVGEKINTIYHRSIQQQNPLNTLKPSPAFFPSSKKSAKSVFSRCSNS